MGIKQMSEIVDLVNHVKSDEMFKAQETLKQIVNDKIETNLNNVDNDNQEESQGEID